MNKIAEDSSRLIRGFLFLGFAMGSVQGAVLITPSAGYNITWDGNDGDFLNGAVPDNRALDGAAFASSVLGVGPHTTPNLLNDGVYGNSGAWIGADESPAQPTAGILLDQSFLITSFAFGRDNTTVFGDRVLGTYTIQLSSNGGISWFSIGTLVYDAYNLANPNWNPSFRHEYEVSITGGDPIQANALRIMVPDGGIAEGTAIDEIEIYGTPVPEPSTLAYLLFTALGTLLRRRRFFANECQG